MRKIILAPMVALLSVGALTACSTATDSNAPDPYAKVKGVAAGVENQPLKPPALPTAAKLGPGWTVNGTVAEPGGFVSDTCGVSAPAGVALASEKLAGPDGTVVEIVSTSMQPSAVKTWFGGVVSTTVECSGPSDAPVQAIPAVKGTTDAAGMRLGSKTSWWTWINPVTGHSATVAVTVDENKMGNGVDVWAAGVARAALAAADGANYGPIGPLVANVEVPDRPTEDGQDPSAGPAAVGGVSADVGGATIVLDVAPPPPAVGENAGDETVVTGGSPQEGTSDPNNMKDILPK